MSNIPATRETDVLNPLSGELVDCSRLEYGAEFITALRDAKLQLDDAIKQAEAVMLEEMATRGQGTVRIGSVELSRKRSVHYEYNMEELLKLLDLGLPQERYDEVVKRVVTEKVDRNALKQVAAARAEYAQVITQATRAVEGRSWVEVKHARRAISTEGDEAA